VKKFGDACLASGMSAEEFAGILAAASTSVKTKAKSSSAAAGEDADGDTPMSDAEGDSKGSVAAAHGGTAKASAASFYAPLSGGGGGGGGGGAPKDSATGDSEISEDLKRSSERPLNNLSKFLTAKGGSADDPFRSRDMFVRLFAKPLAKEVVDMGVGVWPGHDNSRSRAAELCALIGATDDFGIVFRNALSLLHMAFRHKVAAALSAFNGDAQIEKAFNKVRKELFKRMGMEASIEAILIDDTAKEAELKAQRDSQYVAAAVSQALNVFRGRGGGGRGRARRQRNRQFRREPVQPGQAAAAGLGPSSDVRELSMAERSQFAANRGGYGGGRGGGRGGGGRGRGRGRGGGLSNPAPTQGENG
jgi:hypothetical protein